MLNKLQILFIQILPVIEEYQVELAIQARYEFAGWADGYRG